MTLGIDKQCPKNIWFLIKILTKVGFQNNLSVKVRLSLKILKKLGLPEKKYGVTSKNIAEPLHPRSLPAACASERVSCQ
jgi:hypothetical protein